MIPPIALLLPVLFLGAVFSTIGGGGLGILLTIASTFFIDIRASIVLISLLGFVIQAVKIAHFHMYVRWPIVGWYLLLGIPLSFLGAFLLFLLPEEIIKASLALLCLLYVAMHVFHAIPKIQPSKSNLILLGGINGIVGGVVGHGALLRLPTLLSFGLTKEEFIGTSALIAFLMNLGKSVVYVQQFSWTADAMWLFILAVPTVLAGVSLGKRLLRYVSEEAFEKLLLVVIAAGAVRLLIL